MALVLKFEICETKDLKSLEVTDETGVYDAVTNPGGYGPPNQSPADSDSATISVLLPGEDTAIDIDVWPTLPNITGAAYTIANTDLGLASDALLPDGVYHITYNVTFSGPPVSEAETDCNFLISGQSEKCIDNKVVDFLTVKCDGSTILECGVECSDTNVATVVHMRMILRSARAAACCGKTAEAARIIDYLNSLCTSSNC